MTGKWEQNGQIHTQKLQTSSRRGILSHIPIAKGIIVSSVVSGIRWEYIILHHGLLWHLVLVLIYAVQDYQRLFYGKVILFLWIPKPPLKTDTIFVVRSGLL